MTESQPMGQPLRKSGLFWAGVFVGGLILVELIATGISFLRPVMSGPAAHRGVGEHLAFLEIEPLTGDPPRLSSADLQGRVTLLNFWGPWCPPCRAELPHLAVLPQRFAGQGFQLVAISYPNRDDDVASLREETAEVLKRLNVDLSTYHDPGSKTQTAIDRVIGFDGFPTNVLLDCKGVIRAVWVGYQPGVEREVANYIEMLLNEAIANGSGT